MVDIVDEATRSRMMRAIGPRNTAPELAVRRYLHAAGLRFRLHSASLPGRPDLVFPGRRAVLFVHGCFWHRHRGCKFATQPATNRAFWNRKFSENVERDKRKSRALRKAGWRVLVIWQCQVNSQSILRRLAARIRNVV